MPRPGFEPGTEKPDSGTLISHWRSDSLTDSDTQATVIWFIDIVSRNRRSYPNLPTQ